jgi:phage terminase large subunit-like protein
MQDYLIDAMDPCAWVSRNFVGKFLDPLEPWQTQFLNACNFYRQPVLANCARGTGKSELAAIVATHTVLFRNSQTVLLLGPSMNQARELYRRCRRLYDKYESATKPHLITDSKTALELSNDSRLIALPGGNEAGPRSYRCNLLILDEMSFCDRRMVEGAAIPTMSGVPGSRLICISTPNGKEGSLFYEWWETATGFEKILVPAHESKRITPKFLKHMASVTRPEKFDQEFNCKFISGAVSPYFPGFVVDQCFVELEGDAPRSPLKVIS